MPWSTREVAELAGTSLRTVRHYHQIGLLDEPERSSNGYKHYTVTHLIRLLRIRRLVELGFTLPQIAAMEETDDKPAEALRALDAQLAETIARLQRARDEVAVLLEQPEPDPDLPSEVGAVVTGPLTEPDRAFLVLMARILKPAALRRYLDVVQAVYQQPSMLAFDALPPDADQAARARVAEGMVPYIRELAAGNRLLSGYTAEDMVIRPAEVAGTVAAAIDELYNPAQLATLRHLRELMAAES